jgi:hypothetical protein
MSRAERQGSSWPCNLIDCRVHCDVNFQLTGSKCQITGGTRGTGRRSSTLPCLRRREVKTSAILASGEPTRARRLRAQSAGLIAHPLVEACDRPGHVVSSRAVGRGFLAAHHFSACLVIGQSSFLDLESLHIREGRPSAGQQRNAHVLAVAPDEGPGVAPPTTPRGQ